MTTTRSVDRLGRPRRRRAATTRVAQLLCAVVTAAAGGVLCAGPTAAEDRSDTPNPGQRHPPRGPEDVDAARGTLERMDLLGDLLHGVPLVEGDFADPYALSEPDAMYVYATNTTQANVPVLQLPKNENDDARYLGDALPTLPAWTVKGFQWAPSVWARPDGTFVMYYVTPSSSAGGNRACISRATSDDPAGPFVDDSTGAFICPVDEGGAIDPSIVIDDGVPHLLWKSDGNCCGLPTVIHSQRLTPDGLDVAAAAVPLLRASQPWEGNLIEGPSMVHDGSGYVLFYSANDWNSTHYAIGLANCESIDGPCHKPDHGPWMTSSGESLGPGGEEFFQTPGSDEIWMVHHGWLPHEAGTPDGQRRLYVDRVSFRPAAVPTRSNDEAAVETVLEDDAFLAVLAGTAFGLILVAAGILYARRKRSRHHAG
ncbi:MAG: glycoside hydrolase family 43 protein [Microthrixaceae bacterium]